MNAIVFQNITFVKFMNLQIFCSSKIADSHLSPTCSQ